uniref:Vesicle-fusing ATPase n=1 Tax=Astyanax mexicanus TaxID=7994 RepID=A0A8B9HTH3_ASTMX
MATMQAARCPTDELSLTNCAVVSEKDLQSGQHVTVKTTPNHKFVFTVKSHHTVAPGSIAFSLPQVSSHTHPTTHSNPSVNILMPSNHMVTISILPSLHPVTTQ